MSLSLIVQACRRPNNYLNDDDPIYMCNDLSDCIGEMNDKFIVSSFNIEKGAKINEAIELIQQHEKLNASEIIFLQEMDDQGTQQLAESLNMNYLYIPINNEAGTNQDFGNSILTKGEITDPYKLVLPNGQFHNGRMRALSVATISLKGVKFRTASVHLATVFMTSKKRWQQVESLKLYLTECNENHDTFIIGGDFNAVTTSYRKKIINMFDSLGFAHASSGVGTTQSGKIPFLKPEFDMIFSKGLSVLDKGKIVDSSSSDHYPIWTQFLNISTNSETIRG